MVSCQKPRPPRNQNGLTAQDLVAVIGAPDFVQAAVQGNPDQCEAGKHVELKLLGTRDGHDTTGEKPSKLGLCACGLQWHGCKGLVSAVDKRVCGAKIRG